METGPYHLQISEGERDLVGGYGLQFTVYGLQFIVYGLQFTDDEEGALLYLVYFTLAVLPAAAMGALRDC